MDASQHTSGVIYLDDPRYPPLLKEIDDPPGQLFYKGRWDGELFNSCLAVVGSRRMSDYGKEATSLLVKQISLSGVTIVSGFMYGVDAEAHSSAVEVGGKTIAVMPCGIDLVTPSYQLALYERILDTGGLIISEYEGNTAPQAWSFPRRNRIVAGLSHAVLVVEAAAESGSLITARYAGKYNRHVCAVPGSIFSEISTGTHQLIKDGARLINKSSDVLNAIGRGVTLGTNGAQTPLIKTISTLEGKILAELGVASQTSDMLCEKLLCAPVSICTTLSYMVIRGLVREEGGIYYAC